MKVNQLLESAFAVDMQKGADALVAKGWSVTTNDPEGKRGDQPRIMLKKKSTEVKFAWDGDTYVFSIMVKGKGWGNMWKVATSSKNFDELMREIEKNLN